MCHIPFVSLNLNQKKMTKKTIINARFMEFVVIDFDTAVDEYPQNG